MPGVVLAEYARLALHAIRQPHGYGLLRDVPDGQQRARVLLPGSHPGPRHPEGVELEITV